MDGFWLTLTGTYYQGDQVSLHDVAVPQRPDSTYVWQNGAWAQDQAIVNAMKPAPTPRQWLERLSPAAQGGITKAAATDATGALLLWLLKAAGNQTIDVTSAETQQGVQSLVAAGVIHAADAALLLAP